MEVSCLEDTEMEEYVDKLEGLAESLSDEDHVEEEGVYKHPPRPSRRPAESFLRDKVGPIGKSRATLTTEDMFYAQLSPDIRELIVLHTNEGKGILSKYNEIHPDNKRIFIPTILAEIDAFLGFYQLLALSMKTMKIQTHYRVAMKLPEGIYIRLLYRNTAVAHSDTMKVPLFSSAFCFLKNKPCFIY
ncbi:hypothetical protein T02_8502 [Trichinella nativa]|uniref:PiggyBac transposable element-derived protein domain-containing protein n=1 Tax=Trichinella nativa TaxID=6335 RepID=A0A0V1LKA2_9BILA|nr:hypothetical protein T02_8502 [Trichinella nativa]